MGNSCKKGLGPARNVTLAILGLDNAGKTVTTKGLQGEPLESVAPTIGFSSVEFKFDNHHVTLYDLGGGKRIRDIWHNYFGEVYGVIYVIDASEPERMDECQDVLRSLLQHPQVSGKPVLILANKQDKQGALDEIDICEKLDLEDLVNMNKCPCRVETCTAINGQGKRVDRSIKGGMTWLLYTINNMFEKLSLRVEKDVADRQEREKREKEERRERVRKVREERDRQEEEERRLRGEPEKTDGDEEMIDGNPFQRLDAKALMKKEQRLKEEKKKKKEQEALQQRHLLGTKSHLGDNSKLNLRHSQKDDSDEDDDDDDVPQQRAIRSTQARDNMAAPQSHGRINLGPSPRLGRQRIGGPSYSDNSEDDSGDGLKTKSPWGNDRTPRPYDLKPVPSLTPRLQPRGIGAGEEEAENRTLYGRRPLAPLAPLEALDAADKKKKKKKAKKNQTVPSAEDDDEENYQPKVSPFAPRGWNTPPGQRGLLKASKSPRLATLDEPENEKSDNEVSHTISDRWGLDLPELPSFSRRPNSDYGDDLIT